MRNTNQRYEEQLQRYISDLEQRLRRQPLRMPELCKQYLRDNVAKPLQSAVESTFQETMGVSFDDLFKTLQKLDGDIYELQVMQKRPNPRKSFYKERAQYFTMVMPDPALVRHLASESFGDEQIKDIRSYVSKFQVKDSLSLSFDKFRAFFRRHRLATEPGSAEASERPPSPTASGTASHQRQRPGSVESEFPHTQGSPPTRLHRLFSLGSFWARKFRISLMSLLTSVAKFTWFVSVRVATVGFRQKLLSPNLETITALNLLRVYVNRENETKRVLPVDEALVSKFTKYIFPESREESSLIKEIETVINKHIPNMNSSEFAWRFCKKIVEELKSILQIQILEIEKSRLPLRERTPVFSLGRLALSPTLPPWALFWPPLLASVLVAQISGGVPWFLWLFIGLLSVMSVLLGARSFFLARRQLRQAVEQELKKLVSDLVNRTLKLTSSHVTLDWVSQAVKDIDVQLRLRPLQRALDGSLEEVHQPEHRHEIEGRREKAQAQAGLESLKPRLLSVWNPYDYLRLLWWVLVKPEALEAYCSGTVHGIDERRKCVERQSKWLASTLTWWPLIICVAWSHLATQIEVSATVSLGLIVTCSLAWLMTVWLEDRINRMGLVEGYMVKFVTPTFIAFIVSATLMSRVAPFTGIPAELAFIGAIALVGGVANGVTLVSQQGCAPVLYGVVAALFGGGVVGVTFAVPGGVAGGATFILAGGAAVEATVVFLLMTVIITFRGLRGLENSLAEEKASEDKPKRENEEQETDAKKEKVVFIWQFIVLAIIASLVAGGLVYLLTGRLTADTLLFSAWSIFVGSVAGHVVWRVVVGLGGRILKRHQEN